MAQIARKGRPSGASFIGGSEKEQIHGSRHQHVVRRYLSILLPRLGLGRRHGRALQATRRVLPFEVHPETHMAGVSGAPAIASPGQRAIVGMIRPEDLVVRLRDQARVGGEVSGVQ
jgi:hypothetical protein